MNQATPTWNSHPAWKRWAVYITFGFLFLVVAMIVANTPGKPQPAPAQSQAPRMEENPLLRQFSKWDGSHVTSVAAIKAAINDPDSFKHGETVYFQRKDGTIKVLTTFYARNGFGGMVKALAETIVDAQGNVLKLQFLQ